MLNFLSLLFTQSNPHPITLSSSLPTLDNASSLQSPKTKADTAWELWRKLLIVVNVGCFTIQSLLWTEFSLKHQDATSELFSAD